MKLKKIKRQTGVPVKVLRQLKREIKATKNKQVLEYVREYYRGKHDSREEFAIKIATTFSNHKYPHLWPTNCIDWELAAYKLLDDWQPPYFAIQKHYFSSV